MTCNHVRNIISPYRPLFFQWNHIFLNKLQYREELIFRILQKTKEKLHGTITGTPSHPLHGSIQIRNAISQCLDGIGKGKLLVVMRMHSYVLAILLTNLQILLADIANLLREQRTIAVYNINAIDRTLSKHIQCTQNIRLLGIGDRHNVTCGLISLAVCILDHVDRCRHGINISGYTHQINRALILRMDILFIITSSHICHNGNLQIGIVVPDNGTNVIIITKFPFAKLVHIKHVLVCSITKLHIIYSGLHIDLIQSLNKLI